MTDNQPNASPTHRVANVKLTYGGKQMDMRIDVPTRPIRVEELLPLFRSLATHLLNAEIAEARTAGREVSCKKGCGACCRQPVPLTTIEARRLVKLIEGLPEDWRSSVQERFAEARRRLEEAGLLEQFAKTHLATREERTQMALQYVALGIPCPFLQDECCSIYDERPISCREFVVTSPPEYCAKMEPYTVQAITLPAGSVGPAVSHIDRYPGQQPIDHVLMILAPDFVAQHPDEPPPRPGPELIAEFFGRFAPEKKPNEPVKSPNP